MKRPNVRRGRRPCFGRLLRRTAASWGPAARRRPAGPLVLPVLLAAALLAAGCSKGKNALLNPGADRHGLAALPETLRLGLPVADRTIHVQVSTGKLQDLKVARADSVETMVLMRFGALPDTTGITQGQLGLRIHGGETGDLRIEAFAVDSASNWTETTVRWDKQPALLTPIDTSAVITPAPGDTAYYHFYPGAVLIPPRWIQVWKRNPTLGGLALKLYSGSSPGVLDILSHEGVATNSSGVIQLNPRLRVVRGLASDTLDDRAPTEDAFVYHDLRTPAAGSEPLLVVSDWLPSRAIFRIDLRSLPLHLPRGSTVNRALLRLATTGSAPSDTFELGVSQALAPWSESSEPDSMTSGVTTGLVAVPGGVDPATGRIAMDIGSLVQQELLSNDQGLTLLADSLDVQVRAVGEAKQAHRILIYSREEPDTSRRPALDLIYTPPLEARWNATAERKP